ncbi:MAG: hypothetical protein H7A36_04980 [Chlamydiales bacterium]|nr:hypothetical protein [Chlamydiales bacterium]
MVSEGVNPQSSQSQSTGATSQSTKELEKELKDAGIPYDPKDLKSMRALKSLLEKTPKGQKLLQHLMKDCPGLLPKGGAGLDALQGAGKVVKLSSEMEQRIKAALIKEYGPQEGNAKFDQFMVNYQAAQQEVPPTAANAAEVKEKQLQMTLNLVGSTVGSKAKAQQLLQAEGKRIDPVEGGGLDTTSSGTETGTGG